MLVPKAPEFATALGRDDLIGKRNYASDSTAKASIRPGVSR